MDCCEQLIIISVNSIYHFSGVKNSFHRSNNKKEINTFFKIFTGDGCKTCNTLEISIHRIQKGIHLYEVP